MSRCAHCSQNLKAPLNRYCSNKCQADHQYVNYIEDWKSGKVSGTRGINAKNISGHLHRFLSEKQGGACSLCGWNEIHPITGKVPLEIDHIDGDSANNQEANLRLVCPNCHALTPNFRNLNKGNGRSWRRAKYVKVVR
jgi:Zn finger protein HypA/HybF involved in hydrogenase expression